MAATAAGCPVFLCNPDWVKAEWQQVFDLVQPDLIWGELAADFVTDLTDGLTVDSQVEGRGVSYIDNSNKIMIPTGGSSGKIRFTIHAWKTLMASVQGFQEYFQLDKINSFCVLPLYHVSGLMQFVRSFTSGGKLVIMPFKKLATNGQSEIEPSEFFLSLVPTQLQRLLENSELTTWLSRFHTVLLGGAPAWDELLQQARDRRIQLALTYGMTETASQIVTLKPEEFLKGNNSCGQVLPHAKVTIRSSEGKILNSHQIGKIVIQADSLALGYYPEIFINQQYFLGEDLGFFDDEGYLHIVGRSDKKIITGGENVFPSEVEAAIRVTNLVKDVCVIGLPDRYWGEVVTAIYVSSNLQVCQDMLQQAIADKLSKFKHPKHWIPVESLPRNSQGKVNYLKLQQIAEEYIARLNEL
jgi:O-succinylbenzoic acid--CoA ligase